MPKAIKCFCVLMMMCTAGPVLAAESAPHKCFSSVDLNHDGNVDLDELLQAYSGLDRKYFQGLDQDGNGLLNHDEYHQALGHGSLGQ